MAERIRRELGIDVTEQAGDYGEFTVLVDGEPVQRGSMIATMFAVLPPATGIIAAVRARLGR